MGDVTAATLGESTTPVRLSPLEVKQFESKRKRIFADKKNLTTDQIRFALDMIERNLKGHELYQRIEKEKEKRRNGLIRELINRNSNAGVLIGKIKPEERHKMLREKQIIFSIMKYGLEGLDEKALDTVVVCEPMSKQGSLQQLMGRVLRKKEGKKQPKVIFLEDDISLSVGMCSQLRKHLRYWPPDEGGPFDYRLVNNPNNKRILWKI
jgi:superfamily II DNA or RNA helicase